MGVSPTFGEVFEYAAGVRSESIVLPLREDYGQDIGALVRTAKHSYRDVGFIYLCTPNNPTGIVVTRAEVKQLLDGIPEDVPVLVDEAYHHYVDNPQYATSIPYVLEGRPVIVARTFSKIYGLAGMRLGYAVAPKPLIDRMRPHCTGSINALVKWAGVAALGDTAAAERVRSATLQLRRSTTTRARGTGIQVAAVGDELLHGAHPAAGAAGHRRVPGARRAGRTSVSSHARAPARLGRHA